MGLAATLVFELCPQLVVGIFGQGDPLYWEFAIQTFRIFLSLITFTCFIKMTSLRAFLPAALCTDGLDLSGKWEKKINM